MSLTDTVRVWRNAIQLLGSKEKKAFHTAAQQVLDGVENEWLRRRLDPASQDGFFNWPSTDAPGGNGAIAADGWVQEGVLGFLEYRAGKTADLSTPLRQSILAKVFDGVIPPAFPATYLDQWGDPGSAVRLRKIAESISSLNLRHEALWLSQPLRELDLSDASRLPRRSDEGDELLMPLREDR